MALASVCVYGQSKTLHPYTKHKHITLGFQSGRDLLFHSSPLLHSRQSKVHYAISSTLVLRKPLNNYFSIESGIKYSIVQNAAGPINNAFCNNYIGARKPYSVSIPVTIQYYFLPEKSRIRPYIGGGLQYNFNTNGNNITPFHADTRNDYTDQTGTKYISILFTQGITFEINTKIQINQSFHFVPGGTNKTIGIDLGIGFNLP
jgi:outer membrane protein W